MSAQHTPGPWRWQGEDYRGGWGLQMLVGPDGEGLIVGQDADGFVCSHLRAGMPVDSALCITGLAARDKPHVEPVHVFSPANAALIVAAPDLLRVAELLVDWLDEEEGAHKLCDTARAAIAKAKGAGNADPT